MPCRPDPSSRNHVQRCDSGVRDEPLPAVEHVLVTLAARLVRIAALSEPEPGSVSAYAASHSPLASRGRNRRFCSSLPASLIPSEPSSCTATIRPLVAHTFESSSITTSVINALAPTPPCSSPYITPNSSFSRKSSTTSHGNSALLSISAARGPIRSRARTRTSSRISRCSSVSGSRALKGLSLEAALPISGS